MRRLITAGLAALVFAVTLPSNADAMSGRKGRGGGGRAAKAPRASANWSQSKASSKKKGGSSRKSVGVTGKLPNVSVPAMPGGGGRRRGGASGFNTGDPGGATLKRGGTKISVDYKAQPETSTKVPKLDNGGLSGGGSGSAKKHSGGGGGKKHGGGGKKGKRG